MNVLQKPTKRAIFPVLAVKGRNSSVCKGSFGELETVFCAIGLGQSNLAAFTIAHFLFGCTESNVAIRGFHNVWRLAISVDSRHYACITDVTCRLFFSSPWWANVKRAQEFLP